MSATSDPLTIGYEELSYEISTLVASFPPPFIYINDPTSPRVIASLVDSLLQDVAQSEQGHDLLLSPSKRVCYAKVNALACFTQRLLYDSVLNALAGWKVNWDDGCGNWGLEDDSERFNENFDTFIHGLRAVSGFLRDQGTGKGNGKSTNKAKGKGKGKEKMKAEVEDARLVIVIERAERLKENLPEIMVPLTRLAELTQLDLSVIFISNVRWEDIKPPLGASPDPYFIDVSPPTKDAIIQRLTSKFPESETTTPNIYHSAFKGLYTHFVTILCDVCLPFISHDPDEIEYIAAARWPGFVQPLLDEHSRQQQHIADIERDEMNLVGDGSDGETGTVAMSALAPPSEEVRMRLTRLFTSSFTLAMEELHPRLTNATEWAKTNKPEPGLLAQAVQPDSPIRDPDGNRNKKQSTQPGLKETVTTASLPRIFKFILVASFLASTNPAKSDLRMFGRGLDEKRKKRGGRRVLKGGSLAKISQRLLGPVPFPLDRLIAILGALLEENDADVRIPAPEYTIPGEYTDMEISRVGIYSDVMELVSMRLLHRTSPSDRIDGPPSFKCGVSFEEALALAKQLDVPLNDLLWDPA